MDSERNRFEEWYVKNAFNYVRDPIGSRDCSLQWAAWQAGSESHRAELAECQRDVDRLRTYVVWCPDLGQEQEDGATIPATDPADAAEGWAEWHDRSSAEYRIASGREEIVIVRDVETGEQREWIVRGEAMPYYTAQPGESATIRAQVAPGRWEDVPRRSEANK